MTYAATLDFLYSQLPMYQRKGAVAYKKDLSNTRRLLAGLGNPEQKFRSVHIGGTNGKGSTAHMIAGALQHHGLKTGLYTSPHYRDFRERIKIDGQFVSKQFVMGFVRRVRHLIAEIQPSFFELTVAMAFDYFARQQVDVAVVEVGLGGRLDSTNVLQPELSVVTNISFDHQAMLGNTLPLIAAEKAGIIKAGTPVVIGETQEEVRSVFEDKAREMDAPLIYADQGMELTGGVGHHGTIYTGRSTGGTRIPNINFNLLGAFQSRNLRTALASLVVLRDTGNWFEGDPTRIAHGLSNFQKLTNYIPRLMVLARRPTILAGSAHNAAGFADLREYFNKSKHEHLHVVLGVVNDKDLSTMFPYFPQNARYYFAKANIPRGLPAETLQSTAATYGLHGAVFATVAAALDAASSSATADDLIFVGGSIFTVAEVI